MQHMSVTCRYDACDELGVLVYHDMQYAQEGHSPVNSTTQASYASSPSAHGHAPARVRAHTTTRAQEAELRHNIRRLAHHPAIVIWDGCNECTVIIGSDTGIYATFVMTVRALSGRQRLVIVSW